MGLFKNWQDNISARFEQAPPAAEPVQTVVTAPKRTDIKRSYSTDALTFDDRKDLAGVRAHPGYQVLLKIMEMECERFSTALLNVGASNESEVIAAHRLAKSAWQFYIQVQKQVEFEVGELISEQVNPVQDTEMELDERAVALLLDPTKNF